MIEAIARAIFESRCARLRRLAILWEPLAPEQKASYIEEARAALRAMLEAPVSDAMRKAEDCNTIDEAWRAMIAACLEEHP